MACHLCHIPETPAYTCPACINQANQLLTQAGQLLEELTQEATGLTNKTPGGYTTTNNDTPNGINLTAIETSERITKALEALAWRLGVDTNRPGPILEYTYRLAWAWDDPDQVDPLPAMIENLRRAVQAATHLVDTQPPIKTFGTCPTCGTWARHPADRTTATCKTCGEHLTLTDLQDTLTSKTLDALACSWLTPLEMVSALALCGYAVTAKDVRQWGARGKLEAGKRGSRWLFDDVLDMAERREIRRRRIGS